MSKRPRRIRPSYSVIAEIALDRWARVHVFSESPDELRRIAKWCLDAAKWIEESNHE